MQSRGIFGKSYDCYKQTNGVSISSRGKMNQTGVCPVFPGNCIKNSPDYFALLGEFFVQSSDCSISPRGKTEQSSVAFILLGRSTAKILCGLTNPSRTIHLKQTLWSILLLITGYRDYLFNKYGFSHLCNSLEDLIPFHPLVVTDSETAQVKKHEYSDDFAITHPDFCRRKTFQPED